MKRLIPLFVLLLALVSCAGADRRVDPACPDNLVLQNGEELPGLLLDVRFGEVRYLLLSGEEKVFPAAQVVRVDLGRRVGDPSLTTLRDLRDREVLRLIGEAGPVTAGEEYPTTILLDETNHRLENGQVYVTWRRLERINTQPGLDESNVPFTYNALRAKARVDFGYAISPDGKISILSAGSVKDSNLGDGRADGSQERLLQIAIPGGVVGGFVYYQFSVEAKLDPLYSLNVENTFVSIGPTKTIRSIIDVPAGTELNIFERNLAPAVTKTDAVRNGRRVLVYEATNLPQVLPEPQMASWNLIAPYFAVALKTDWPSIARYYWDAAKPKLQPNEAVTAQAKKLTEGKTGQEAASALYAFVLREVPDNGVGIWDRDGLPKPPEKTLADRRGSLLDRTVLVYALAKASDLPANLCLLVDRLAHAPEEQTPHATMLGTPLLRFDFAGAPPIWTSLGDTNRIFGHLDSSETDSFYLDLATGRTGRTPVSSSAIDRAEYVYDIYLQPDGSARIVEEHRLYGAFGQSYRGYRHLEAEQVRDRMTRTVRSFAFRNRLVEFSIEGMQDLRDPIILRRVSETPMFAVGSGGRYSFIRLFDVNYGDLAEVNPVRLYPFERAGLYEVSDVYRFHLPPGATAEGFGGPVAADSPWCTYRSGWRLEGDLLTFEDRTVYTQTEMPASGFTAFKALLKARRDTSNVVVLIEPAVANEPAPR